MATADPTDKLSTHDIVITHPASQLKLGLVLANPDGSRNKNAFRQHPIHGSSIKTYTGPAKHSDLEGVYTPIMQNDWSGGRGAIDFERDQSAYADGSLTQTMRTGEIILAGMQGWSRGFRGSAEDAWNRMNTREGVGFNSLLAELNQWQISIPDATISGNYTGIVYLIVRKHGTPNTLQVSSYGATAMWDTVPWASAGTPGSLLAADIEENIWTIARIPGTYNSSGRAWLMFYTVPTASGYWEIMSDTEMDSARMEGTIAGGWDIGSQVAARQPFVRFTSDDSSAIVGRTLMAEYKNSLYAVISYNNGNPPRVFLNGDQGAATGGAANSLLDSTKTTWTEGRFEGAIIKLTGGPGSTQPQNWRIITQTFNGGVYVSPNWDIAPAAGTEYVIVSTDWWVELTGHGLYAPVTCLLPANGALYICQGDAANVTRMRRYTTGTSTWATQWADEGYTASYMVDGSDQQGAAVYRANHGYPAVWARAAAVDCTANIAAAALSGWVQKTVGDYNERVNGLTRYGPYGNLWILKESSVHQVVDGNTYEVAIPEMRSTLDDRNGQAHLWHSKYLYFSWHNGLESYYYEGDVKGMGPDKSPAGMPAGRRGPISALAGYAGMIFAAVDGGLSGTSSVLAWNGIGWCEIWRATGVGLRIRALHMQSCPGDAVDRLWISVGGDLVWVPISLDPYTHPGYSFAVEGHLITAWYYLNLNEVYKFWNSLRMIIDAIDEEAQPVFVEYQVDGQTSWTAIADVFTTFAGEIKFTGNNSLASRRIRLRIRLLSMSASKTPRITASVIEGAVRVITKYSYTLAVRVADDDHDIQGNHDPQSAGEKLVLLRAFNESPLPATVEAINPLLNGIVGFIDSVQAVPLDNSLETRTVGHYVTFQIVSV